MEHSSGGGVASIIMSLIYLVIFVALIAGMWKTFEKAGKPGWAAIIPIYNMIVLLEIIDRPMWWMALLICVSPIGLLLAAMDMAENFGKSKGWGVLMLWLLSPIGYALLGFGADSYTKVSRQ